MGMAGPGTATEADENAIRKTRNRHSVVHEEMENEWERVDMQQEVTEGDASITRPFNVEVSFYDLFIAKLTDSTTYTYLPTSIICLQHG